MIYYDALALENANEFAEKGTVMHFAMRLGFMPHNEEQAEATLKRYMDDLEKEIKEFKREELFASSPIPVVQYQKDGKDADEDKAT